MKRLIAVLLLSASFTPAAHASVWWGNEFLLQWISEHISDRVKDLKSTTPAQSALVDGGAMRPPTSEHLISPRSGNPNTFRQRLPLE